MNPVISGMQTPVALSAGETKHIRLTSSGVTAVARLINGRQATLPPWTNAVAILSRVVAVPLEPQRSDFVSNESQAEARKRYARDPKVLAALREQRDFVTTVAPEGLAVFEQIPPGRYTLQVKLFKPAEQRTRSPVYDTDNVAAQVRAPVVIPEAADESMPVTLGEFTLEPL